jgi:hypothetical protein
MKRSESDRFAGDLSRPEQQASAEVYVIVSDEARRAGLLRRRYFALAIAISGIAVAILVMSFDSGEKRGRPASASSCVDAGGYGGLGARIDAFDANNSDSTGAAGPSPGTAFYVVTGMARGCVTAFAVQDSATPPLAPRDLLGLVSHPFLPGDAKQLVSTDSCAVWKSRALRRATGQAYARATAITQAGSSPGTAQIAATANSVC